MKKIGWFILFLSVMWAISVQSGIAQVQPLVEDQNAAGVWQALLRLQTTATVLHTTAHPDDEDGALLTWLSRGHGVRTGLFSLTRGEGGANLIGPELFDALGIVRTEELLVATRHYSVDLFYSRAVDFGYSKRLDEALEKWDREILLADAVHMIRKYRPDVIISRFRGNQRDGHGHHQTSGVITLEAFRAAADPARFPEQIAAGLQAWQAKKLYIAPFVRRGAADPSLLKIDTGAYDPLLGRSYLEMARKGLSYQRSQGAGSRRGSRGAWFSHLQLIDTAIPKLEREESLFDGLDTTIVGMAKLSGLKELIADFAELQAQVEGALAAYDARRPWFVMPYLARGLRKTRGLIEKIRDANIGAANKDHLLFLLRNKELEFMDAANKALGLSMEVLVDPPAPPPGMPAFFRSRETFAVAIPGQYFTLTTSVVNPSPLRIEPIEVTLRTPEGWKVSQHEIDLKPLGYNERMEMQFGLTVPEDAEYSQPYWSRGSEYHDDIYTIHRPEFLFLPFAPPEVVGEFTYRVEGMTFAMAQPVQTVQMNRPWGEQRRLLTVAPAISVTVSTRVGVIPVNAVEPTFTVRVEVRNNVKGAAQGQLRLRLPEGWTSTPATTKFTFTHEGEIQTFPFRLSIPQEVEAGANYIIQAIGEYNGKTYTEGYQVIAHPDLEPRHLYRPASIELRGIEVKIAPDLKVGYIMGVGDKVPEALEQIGIKVQMLDSSGLATGNLNEFDTILIGIRAYAVREDLKAYNRRLLDYVKQGGNLIVQYQTPEFDAAPFGPYPYKLGRRPEEVSEEAASVAILDTTHAIFTTPNLITPSDFDGWVEERGSKFMTEWDSNYKPLLMCNDRDQEPQRGGLLQAKYGQGTYTYAAYAFYRQLPAGVAGAYRLFANMISIGKGGEN
ncbi:PIG-L family deacetylase [Candidatus Poribacteria bacterium]|nr:PIG-L family deacetylase [Candidatus Poribacteria bacterium]